MPQTIIPASNSAADVNSAIGKCVDGDTVQISGDCHWTSKVTIPDTVAITLQGTGLVTIPTPSNTVSSPFASGTMANPTTIYDEVAAGPLLTVKMKKGTAASPQTALKTRVTGFSFVDTASRTNSADHTAGESGTVCFLGNDNRYDSRAVFDNCAWNHIYGECVTHNICGVFSKIIGFLGFGTRAGTHDFLYPMCIKWNGGNWGDLSVAGPLNWGMVEFGLVVEDSTFIGNTAGWCDVAGGAGRLCVRHCQFGGTGTAIQTHGTESGSPAGLSGTRGVAAIDAYENHFYDTVHAQPFMRGGVIMYHDNHFHQNATTGVGLRQYRLHWGFGPWGFADGANPWDKNFPDPNLGPYTVTVGTGGSQTETVTAKQGASTTPFSGLTLAGYQIVKTSATASANPPYVNTCGIIQSNTNNAITYYSGFTVPEQNLTFAVNDTFKIMHIDAPWDAPGMHYGNPITRQSSLVPNLNSIGGTAPSGYRNSGGAVGLNDQVVTPCYCWSQTGAAIAIAQNTDKTIREGVHYFNNTTPPNVGPDGPGFYQTLTYPHPLLGPAGPQITGPFAATFYTDKPVSAGPPPVNTVTLAASGFTGPITWSSTGGGAPNVTFSAAGVFSGQPTGGTTSYVYHITAHHTGDTDATADFTLFVQNPNLPPSVTISTNGTTFLAGATVTITAAASDPEGQVAQVEFLDGATSLLIDQNSPYSYSSTTFTVGSHVLSAKVTDGAGNTVVSTNQITITVNPVIPGLAPPQIAVSASAQPPPVTPPISTQFYGIYSGPTPGGPTAVDAHQTLIGRTVQRAVAFSAATWNDIAGNSSLVTGWQTWKGAQSGRKMVFSIGVLPKTTSGETLAIAATGTYDHYFTDLANNLISRGMGDSIIRLGWEFNGDWYSWSAQTDPTSFKAAWIHEVNAMRAVSGANFTFCFNPSQGRNNNFDATTAYPGDAYVDYIGLDIYDVSFAANTYPYSSSDPTVVATAQQTAWNNNLTRTEGLNFWMNFALTHGKLFSLPEWGCANRPDGHGGLDNPYYIQQMYDYIADPAHSIEWYAYFDVDDTAGIIHQLDPTTTFPNASAKYFQLF